MTSTAAAACAFGKLLHWQKEAKIRESAAVEVRQIGDELKKRENALHEQNKLLGQALLEEKLKSAKALQEHEELSAKALQEEIRKAKLSGRRHAFIGFCVGVVVAVLTKGLAGSSSEE